MITLSIFTDFCSWWWLAWLLPFLLGLLLGWALWAHWKKKFQALETELSRYKKRVTDLEADLDTCKKRRAELEGEVSIANGRASEADARTASAEAATKAANARTTAAESAARAADARIATADAAAKAAREAATMAQAKAAAIASSAAAVPVVTNSLTATPVKKETPTPKVEEHKKVEERKTDARNEEERKTFIKKPAVENAPEKIVKVEEPKLEKPKADASKIVAPIAAASSMAGASKSVAPKANKYAKLKEDNLQIIEGIGPKMNEVLVSNGVTSWSVLAGKSVADLKGILGKYGDKYKIIDPSEWAAQAQKAADGNWDGLIAMQKDDGSDSKAEKLMVKLGILKAWKENDLKAVEGIGPKIEQLLNKAGITTWRGLATTSVDKINTILAAAGDRYKLADPGTWPKQAEYAADGKWDELEEYQDFLDGGKAPS